MPEQKPALLLQSTRFGIQVIPTHKLTMGVPGLRRIILHPNIVQLRAPLLVTDVALLATAHIPIGLLVQIVVPSLAQLLNIMEQLVQLIRLMDTM